MYIHPRHDSILSCDRLSQMCSMRLHAGQWAILLVFSLLMIVFKIYVQNTCMYSKISFRYTVESVEQFGPRSDPDLGPNCLQRLSAEVSRRQRAQ